MILLGKEQEDDDKKKEFCTAEFDKTEDKQKVLTKSISDVEKEIAEQEDVLGSLTEEIAALKKGIAELDVSVAVATEQRKQENEEFSTQLAANNAAKQLIEMAKNRMQKFYNPKLYKPPPKRELSEEDRITLNMGGTLAPTEPPGGIAGTGITALDQEASFVQLKAHSAPEDFPAPTALLQGDSRKEDAGGVLAMMDLLINDLSKDILEMEMEEKDSQEDYEATMADAAEKRKTDSKAITEKEGAKAELDAEHQAAKDAKKADDTELIQTNAYMADLHEDCDWLMENYDSRKEARANEVDAMKKAKDVLNGADYSFLQTIMTAKRLPTSHDGARSPFLLKICTDSSKCFSDFKRISTHSGGPDVWWLDVFGYVRMHSDVFGCVLSPFCFGFLATFSETLCIGNFLNFWMHANALRFA